MSLLDKAKEAAEKARVAAQQGMQQGQAKLDAMQAKRRADALLRDLGGAYYAERRHGGSHDAVEAALSAVDTHIAEHGHVDTAPGQPDATSPV
jgi:hypothetical protein